MVQQLVCLYIALTGLGLLLGTEAYVMKPNGVHFFFLYVLALTGLDQAGAAKGI